MRIHYLVIIILFFQSIQSFGQQEKNTGKFINFRHFGAFSEFGIPLYELPEETTYMPLLIGATYNLPYYQAKRNFNISVEFKPQFGYILSTMKNIEFGLNVMFNFNYLMSKNSYLTFKISSGPHYINMETRRQAKGFIFSDNFILGYYRKLQIFDQDYSIGLVSGIRHISNASIKRPNGGINNVIVGLSFAKLF